MNVNSGQSRNLCFLSAGELAQEYRIGRSSPIDVIDAHLTRIDILNERLHAFTEVFRDDARNAAAASAERHKAGRPLGALDGIPIALKDLFEIEGKMCSAGSATRAGQISERTASAVTRLGQHGAILLGKTQTTEFALGGWGTNARLGSPRNPWVPKTPYTAGGSSSGSAVAVAARLATLAIGTDTGGSVRIPAAFNGLVGLKTTPGRISLEGVIPLSPSFDTVGPIARTVCDAAVLFTALIDRPASGADHLAVLHSGIAGLVLGGVGEDVLAHVHPDIAHAYEASLNVLRTLGARLKRVNLPRRPQDYQHDQGLIMAAEAYARYGELAENPSVPMDPAVRARVLGGDVSARSYIQARYRAIEQTHAVEAVLKDCHALLTPTAETPPIPLADVDETTTPSTLTRFVNLIGFCALAVPNGLTSTGLPTSLQIVCRPNDEDLALRIGLACELDNPLQNALPPAAMLA